MLYEVCVCKLIGLCMIMGIVKVRYVIEDIFSVKCNMWVVMIRFRLDIKEVRGKIKLYFYSMMKRWVGGFFLIVNYVWVVKGWKWVVKGLFW